MPQPMLVTGGAGFIGSAFVRRWIGEQRGGVVTYDKLTYAGHRGSLAAVEHDPAHAFVLGDVCSPTDLRAVLEAFRPWAVVHFAAESHVDRSIDDPSGFVSTNVVGTFELLRASLAYWRCLPPLARERFRFLHVSTDEVYGDRDGADAATEGDAYAPNSPYAASKAASDHFVRAYSRTYGLPTLTAHSSNNYGPFQFPEKFIPHTVLRAGERLPVPIYGDGQQARDWLHVDDHCQALQLMLERGAPGSVYNVGSGHVWTNRWVAQSICDLVDHFAPARDGRLRRDLLRTVHDRPGHDRRYCLDSTRIRKDFGWAPQWTFAEGLRNTVEWYFENQPWIDGVLAGEYRLQRLGLDRGVVARTA